MLPLFHLHKRLLIRLHARDVSHGEGDQDECNPRLVTRCVHLELTPALVHRKQLRDPPSDELRSLSMLHQLFYLLREGFRPLHLRQLFDYVLFVLIALRKELFS